ncbi:hypothetical protein Bca52824_091654 [Brassica carinata]|uniref:Uncharacterized protein n=1 Tax=Brassica carinata TaxID=52824 RepID=A0A8X7NSX5_BRACI|nr:hypothetical protein Bca52824_091654 [Brassica carinata]
MSHSTKTESREVYPLDTLMLLLFDYLVKKNLSLEEMRKLSPVFEEDVFGYLGVENSVNKFSSYGSTGSNCVAEQLGYWVNKLKITTT